MYRIEESRSGNDTLSVGDTVQGWLRDSFDNDATPFFALIICLWGEIFVLFVSYCNRNHHASVVFILPPFCAFLGTIFLEFWKRKSAELAYQWDVSDFEEQVCTSWDNSI